jgi:hypothetical protein
MVVLGHPYTVLRHLVHKCEMGFQILRAISITLCGDTGRAKGIHGVEFLWPLRPVLGALDLDSIWRIGLSVYIHWSL